MTGIVSLSCVTLHMILCVLFSEIREEMWYFDDREKRKIIWMSLLWLATSMPTVIRGTKPTSRSFIAVGSR